MLDMISFAILGFWLGYLLCRITKRSFGKGIQFGFAILVAVLMVVVLIAIGSSPEASGRWAFFAAVGAFFSSGSPQEIIEKLKKTWAGLWLFMLFAVVEGFRIYLVFNLGA